MGHLPAARRGRGRHESLTEALERAEREDPAVAAAAAQLAWLAQKAAMHWPSRRVFRPGPDGVRVEHG